MNGCESCTKPSTTQNAPISTRFSSSAPKTIRSDPFLNKNLVFLFCFGRYAGRETELIRAVEAKYGYSSEGPFPARQGADVRATQGSVEPATPPHSPARPRATCSAEVPLTTPPRVSAAVVAAATAGVSPSPPDTAHAGPQDAKEEMDSAAASLFSTSAYCQRQCSLPVLTAGAHCDGCVAGLNSVDWACSYAECLSLERSYGGLVRCTGTCWRPSSALALRAARCSGGSRNGMRRMGSRCKRLFAINAMHATSRCCELWCSLPDEADDAGSPDEAVPDEDSE